MLKDIAFRVLAANNTPDFRTISDFRKDHLAALADLFHQVLELCRQAGLVKLGHVVLDSTKVRANASRHKAMSYGRIKKKEAQLKAEVDDLLRRAGEVDIAGPTPSTYTLMPDDVGNEESLISTVSDAVEARSNSSATG